MRKFKDVFEEKLSTLREIFPERAVITIPQAAKLCGCAAARLRDDMDLPKIKLGKQQRVELSSLARWLTDKEYKEYKEAVR